MAVTAAGVMILVVVGGLIGRLVYQVVERPRQVVVYIDRAQWGCSVRPSDRIELVTAYTSEHLAWPTHVVVSDSNPAQSAVVFEINRQTPDFDVVDTRALWTSDTSSYADVDAAGRGGLAIDGCVEGGQAGLRADPLRP